MEDDEKEQQKLKGANKHLYVIVAYTPKREVRRYRMWRIDAGGVRSRGGIQRVSSALSKTGGRGWAVAAHALHHGDEFPADEQLPGLRGVAAAQIEPGGEADDGADSEGKILGVSPAGGGLFPHPWLLKIEAVASK